MRIVGGSLRGRRLLAPEDRAVRPTTDRARETLFNILASRGVLRDAHVLDAFCGTGALGCEALSRGSASAHFWDIAPASLSLARRNVEALGLEAVSTLARRDATRPSRCDGPAFTLVFADPPYGKGMGEACAAALASGGWLRPDALLVLEERAGSLPETLGGFETVDERRLGDTAFGFYSLEDDRAGLRRTAMKEL